MASHFSLPISGFKSQCLLLQLPLEGVGLGTLEGAFRRERVLSDRGNNAGVGQRLQDGLLREPDTQLALEGSDDELGLALAASHQHGLNLAHLVIHAGMPCAQKGRKYIVITFGKAKFTCNNCS